MKVKYSGWYTVNVCSSCQTPLKSTILGKDELMYASGICCHCGADSGCTIVDYDKIILRALRHKHSLMFWKNFSTYEGRGPKDKKWLNDLNEKHG